MRNGVASGARRRLITDYSNEIGDFCALLALSSSESCLKSAPPFHKLPPLTEAWVAESARSRRGEFFAIVWGVPIGGACFLLEPRATMEQHMWVLGFSMKHGEELGL